MPNLVIWGWVKEKEYSMHYAYLNFSGRYNYNTIILNPLFSLVWIQMLGNKRQKLSIKATKTKTIYNEKTVMWMNVRWGSHKHGINPWDSAT